MADLAQANDLRHAAHPVERLKAYVVSDVHMNNHPYDHAHDRENPRRRNFREFLTQVNEALLATDKLQLVLNGDILDITGSWYDNLMPWDADQAAVEKIFYRILEEIVATNETIFNEMRRMLAWPNTEIVYIIGNHDGMFEQFPAGQEYFKHLVCPDPELRKRIRFATSFVSEELELYVEHGHNLDPFNHNKQSVVDPPLGDVINILIVNRFVDMAGDRLKENGYSDELVSKLFNRLHDIEYLRPLTLVPLWIQSMANHYKNHPENAGKKESVDQIIMKAVSDVMLDHDMISFLVKHLHIPRSVMTFAIKALINVPAILPVISFITSKLVRRTHSNKYQYKTAQKLHDEKNYRLIAYGHTHIPSVLPLSKTGYYFNTGSWKPVINLFKFSKNDPIEIEYLVPEVQFNKVERCGILRIEKNELAGNKPAQFYLQTIQSGVS